MLQACAPGGSAWQTTGEKGLRTDDEVLFPVLGLAPGEARRGGPANVLRRHPRHLSSPEYPEMGGQISV